MLREELGNQLVAILFAAEGPVTAAQLGEVFADLPEAELTGTLTHLCESFQELIPSMEVRKVAGGYRITTKPEYHQVVCSYLKTRPAAKLSLAALETLAAIAYKQPITLPEIMEIRGIKNTSTIRTLLEKRLIETRGRRKVIGRPIMYGTTREFLVHFGLADLKDLPTLKEFQELLDDSS